ncbi:uridine diphosphate-N-acetylglucosamine-binding protein YvcK [Cryptosporangium sp. NPDC051539]|uniref:uridine diphosphate-N-acetylglucosamine-binding protein YvcK n=1 Tax=Cryptosporangium sp. NPDC051539 TaxID=3363962 RepID=UPI0037916FC6
MIDLGAERPPRVVAFGGGHGLFASLKALCLLGIEPTAVVTVADDGGSSGRLRREFGGIPPGDLRQALVALADPADPVSAALFQHRFPGGGELGGHAVGNLVLAGLADILGGTVPALEHAARALGCRGRVLPMASQPLDIQADVAGALGNVITVHGQHAVASTKGQVRRVRLTPSDVPACPEALEAVSLADTLVLGPGSWFTSVLPHFLVPELADAIVGSPARRILVLNLSTDSETHGMPFEDHLHALADHAPALKVDVVLADPHIVRDHTGLSRAAESLGGRLVVAPVAASDGTPRHDQKALAAALRTVLGTG